MLAAAIAVGFAANAASYKWTGANIYGADATTKFTGTAEIYAYLSTATKADAVKVTDVAITAGALNATYNWTDAVVGSTYNFYMVITDGDKVLDTSATTPAIIKAGVAQATTTQSVVMGNMQSATQAAGNWAAVPEPTSGLMLLLGVAGLALKRKRA